MRATGWQAQSVRDSLADIEKKMGLNVYSFSRNGTHIYALRVRSRFLQAAPSRARSLFNRPSKAKKRKLVYQTIGGPPRSLPGARIGNSRATNTQSRRWHGFAIRRMRFRRTTSVLQTFVSLRNLQQLRPNTPSKMPSEEKLS